MCIILLAVIHYFVVFHKVKIPSIALLVLTLLYLLISFRVTLGHAVFGLLAGFFLPVSLVQDFD